MKVNQKNEKKLKIFYQQYKSKLPNKLEILEWNFKFIKKEESQHIQSYFNKNLRIRTKIKKSYL